MLWTSLTQEDLSEFGTNNEAKGDIIDELLSNAEEADLVLLLEERPGNILHGSIRITSEDLDGTVIAQKFGGGGHAKACGFNIENASVQSHSQIVVQACKDYIDSIRQNPSANSNVNASQANSAPAATVFPQESINPAPAEPVIQEPVVQEEKAPEAVEAPAEPVIQEPVVQEEKAPEAVETPAEPVIQEPVVQEEQAPEAVEAPAEPVIQEPAVQEEKAPEVVETPAEPVIQEPAVQEEKAPEAVETPAEPVIQEPVVQEELNL